MSEQIVAKLRSGFITDACGVPLRGSTEKIMDEAADLLEQQAKELAECQARVVELEERERMRLAGISTAAFGYWKEGDSIHSDYDTVALRDVAHLYQKYAALASTDTADIVAKVREKHYEECAVICLGEKVANFPAHYELAIGDCVRAIRAAIGGKP